MCHFAFGVVFDGIFGRLFFILPQLFAFVMPFFKFA